MLILKFRIIDQSETIFDMSIIYIINKIIFTIENEIPFMNVQFLEFMIDITPI